MKTGRTGCGIRYAVRRGGNAAAYCALSIKCGTRSEEGYNEGIAHFTEHTIFKGTDLKSASVINSYIDRLGGELNAYTTKEEIVLHATVLKEDIAKAASLLFELASSCTFPEKEIEKEKGVVIDEINSYKDSPSEEIYDRFEEMLFKGHPLSRSILGTRSSVKKITRPELLKFAEEKFVPENMVFTAVADIPEGRLESMAERLSGKFYGKPYDGMPGMHSVADKSVCFIPRRFDKTVSKRNYQANCVMGNVAPSLYEEKERVATVLLCNILGGPASNSILNSVLREKNGWVYGVECSYTQYSDTGIAVVSMGCDKSNLEKCLRATAAEIARIQSDALGPLRLKAAKKQLLGQLAISADSGEAQCLSMGKSMLAYGIVYPDEEIRMKVESVTSEEIMYAARRIFDDESVSRLIFY